MNKAVIQYANWLKPAKYEEFSRLELYAMLFEKFSKDTGLKNKDIEGLFVTSSPTGIGAEQVVDYLKIKPKHCCSFDIGGATGAFMLKSAEMAIKDGLIDNALIISAGKFDEFLKDGRGIIKQVCEPNFEFIYEPSVPSMYALFAQRYLWQYNLNAQDLALVPVATRKWANLNSDAVMHSKKLAVEDVINSPLIATPFHLFDCSIPISGGGLIYLTRDDMALDFPKVYLLGYGEAQGFGFISSNEDFTSSAAKESAKRAFTDAKINKDAIDFLQLYDAFSICPLILLEDLGFYEKGKAVNFFKEKKGEPEGSLPFNTFGGLLSFGHAGISGGLFFIIETILQLQKKAGERQLPKANIGLAHTYGGMFASHITLILGRENNG